jgi:hypothetical protein
MIFGAWSLQGLHKALTNNVKALSFERRRNYGRREGIGVYLSIYLSMESVWSVNYVGTKYHSLFGSVKPN